MPRLSALLLSLLAVLPATAATPEEDAQRYIAVFQAGADSDRAVDDLGWMGISDTHLFDLIEQRLINDSRGLSLSQRPERNHVARLIKALGYSGQAKYEATLSALATEYRHPVERALISLKLYAKWNPIISDRAGWDSTYADDINRVRNMLRSDDIQLQSVGAKRVFFVHSNEPMLLDMVAERLRACYKTVTVNDPDALDAAGWMVNALGKSNDAKHRVLLQEVAAGAANLKLSNRAQKNLR